MMNVRAADRKIARQIFQAIQIQTIEFCNRSCYFCPQSRKSKTNIGNMSDETFRLIIDQLNEIGFSGRVSPYLMNECFTDDRICDFISYARLRLPESVIFINTNGDRLRESDFLDRVLNTDIDVLQINCYDNQRHFEEMAALIEARKRSIGRVLLHDEHTRLIKMAERNGMLNIRIKRIFGAKGYFWNRGGNIPPVQPDEKYGNLRECAFPHTQFYINYRGDSILCCSDWEYEVIFGNVQRAHILEIWNSPSYGYYGGMHKSERGKELHLCNRCNRIIR